MDIANVVYAIDVSFLSKENEFKKWYDRMPDYRKRKIDAFKPAQSKYLSLGAGILLYKEMERLGISDAEIALADNQKPYIKSADGIRFNLSHSGNLAVCAFSDSEVGVDIERKREFDEKLIEYVYNPEEIKYIKNHSRTTDEKNFLSTGLWTVKESLMKYTGRGVAMEPSHIFLQIDEEDRIKAYYNDESYEKLFFTGYEYGDYHVCVCSEYENFSDEIKFVTGDD